MKFLPLEASQTKATVWWYSEVSLLKKNITADENLCGMIQAEMIMDEVMFLSFIYMTFSHIRQLPSSLSDSHLE